jgi:hypothetical protein
VEEEIRRDLDHPIVYVRERRGTHHNYNSKTDIVVVVVQLMTDVASDNGSYVTSQSTIKR